MRVGSLGWASALGVLAATLCGFALPRSGAGLEAGAHIVGGRTECFLCADVCHDGTQDCEEPATCLAQQDPQTGLWACRQVLHTYSAICRDVGESGISTECTPGSESTHCAEVFLNVCAPEPALPSCTTSTETCGTKYTCTLGGSVCPQGQ
jgi:hypothetical protein